MKIMKTRIITITLLLSVSVISMACDRGKHRNKMHNGEHRKFFVSSLNLDAKQKVQFDTIMAEKKERMQDSMKRIHEETNGQLEKILSPEQMLLLAENKPKKGRKSKGRKGKDREGKDREGKVRQHNN